MSCVTRPFVKVSHGGGRVSKISFNGSYCRSRHAFGLLNSNGDAFVSESRLNQVWQQFSN